MLLWATVDDILCIFDENGLEKVDYLLCYSDGPVITEFLLICSDGLVIVALFLFTLLLLLFLNGLVMKYFFLTLGLTVCHDWVCLLGLSMGHCMAQLAQLVSKLMMHRHD